MRGEFLKVWGVWKFFGNLIRETVLTDGAIKEHGWKLNV